MHMLVAEQHRNTLSACERQTIYFANCSCACKNVSILSFLAEICAKTLGHDEQMPAKQTPVAQLLFRHGLADCALFQQVVQLYLVMSGATVLGVLLAAASAFFNGSFGALSKVEAIQHAAVTPLHFNSWVAVGLILSTIPLLAVDQVMSASAAVVGTIVVHAHAAVMQ